MWAASVVVSLAVVALGAPSGPAADLPQREVTPTAVTRTVRGHGYAPCPAGFTLVRGGYVPFARTTWVGGTRYDKWITSSARYGNGWRATGRMRISRAATSVVTGFTPTVTATCTARTGFLSVTDSGLSGSYSVPGDGMFVILGPSQIPGSSRPYRQVLFGPNILRDLLPGTYVVDAHPVYRTGSSAARWVALPSRIIVTVPPGGGAHVYVKYFRTV